MVNVDELHQIASTLLINSRCKEHLLYAVILNKCYIETTLNKKRFTAAINAFYFELNKYFAWRDA